MIHVRSRLRSLRGAEPPTSRVDWLSTASMGAWDKASAESADGAGALVMRCAGLRGCWCHGRCLLDRADGRVRVASSCTTIMPKIGFEWRDRSFLGKFPYLSHSQRR